MTTATTANGAQNTLIKVILALQYPPRSFVRGNNLEPIIDGGVPEIKVKGFMGVVVPVGSSQTPTKRKLPSETIKLLFCKTSCYSNTNKTHLCVIVLRKALIRAQML